MHVHSEVSSIVFTEICSQESVYKIVALHSKLGFCYQKFQPYLSMPRIEAGSGTLSILNYLKMLCFSGWYFYIFFSASQFKPCIISYYKYIWNCISSSSLFLFQIWKPLIILVSLICIFVGTRYRILCIISHDIIWKMEQTEPHPVVSLLSAHHMPLASLPVLADTLLRCGGQILIEASLLSVICTHVWLPSSRLHGIQEGR